MARAKVRVNPRYWWWALLNVLVYAAMFIPATVALSALLVAVLHHPIRDIEADVSPLWWWLLYIPLAFLCARWADRLTGRWRPQPFKENTHV